MMIFTRRWDGMMTIMMNWRSVGFVVGVLGSMMGSIWRCLGIAMAWGLCLAFKGWGLEQLLDRVYELVLCHDL